MTRRRPLSDIEELLDRLTEELDDGLGADLTLTEIPLDIVDRGDAFLVRAELAGYSSDDLEVELHDNQLRIEAKREGEAEELTGRYVRRERHEGAVSRSITLPEAVDETAVSATFERGLLEITLPKAADVGEGHTIEID